MAFTKVAPAGIGSTPGDGYRIGDSFLHSTGVEITNINATGIVTAASLDISGAIDFDGHTELDNVNISGVSTFAGNIDANGDLDVDGHTNLDNVSISGVTTSGNITISSTAPVLYLTDTNADSDFSLVVNGGSFRLRDETNSTNRFTLSSTGTGHFMGTCILGESTFGSSSRTKVYSGQGTICKNALMVLNPSASVAGRGAGVAVGAIGNGDDYIGTLYGSRDSNGDNRGTTTLEGKDDIVIKTNASGTAKTVATFDASGNVNFGSNTSSNPFTYLRFGASLYGAADIRPTDEGSHKIGLAFYTDGTQDTTINPTERVRIDSSGRLQIGSSTLATRNQFNGPGRLTIQNNSADGTVDFSQGIIFTDNSNNTGTWTHGGIVCTGSTGYNGNLIFGTDNTGSSDNSHSNIGERMRISSVGYVGINSIAPTTYLSITASGNQRQDMLKLQHMGQRTFYIQGQWGQRDIGDSNGILQYVDGGGIAFRSGTTGDASMIVSQANKVGIHTNNPSVNLHAFMANTTNASLTWGANCGQIFRNEGSELAFGLQNTAPYPYYLQARTNASSARQLALNPAGGAVSVNTNNSFSRTFNVKGTIGVLSPSQITALDLAADDGQNVTISSYHASGSNLYLRTNYSGAGVQNRLHINGSGESSFYGTSSGNSIGITIRNQNTANYSHARLRLESQNNAKASDIYTDVPNDALRLQYNGSNSVYIKDTGRVGITTNTPGSALHVRGGGGIRVDPLGNLPANQNDTYLSDGVGNPLVSGTPWFTTSTFQWQGSYSGMGYYWIKVVKSLGSSALGYIEYLGAGDSNYPRTIRGTIAIAKYADGSISCCHDQQTQEAGGVEVRLCGDGTVWIRLSNYDWNSDFRFRLIYGESVTLNTDFTITGSSDNSYGRIDPRGGGSPVNSSPAILPGANQRYSVSGNTFNPSGANSTYSNDDHRFFRINVASQLTKGSGSFRIDHPLAGMSTSHYLQHSFVEGPQADNIYRGKTTLVAGISTVNIDTASSMTDGTFVELNTDVQCFTTNETGWTPIKGTVSGNKLTIMAQDNSCTDTISWMVVGERQDDHIKNQADWTDSDGKVIVELPKRNVGFAGTESPYEEFK